MLFEETATPEAVPEVGVNRSGWLALVPAKTTLIFAAVVPVPLLVAVIGTQDITPATSDCKTEVPVAGLVAGKVYTVLPDAEDTNAV